MKHLILLLTISLIGCSSFREPKKVPYIKLDGRVYRVDVNLEHNKRGAKPLLCYDRTDGSTLCLLIEKGEAVFYEIQE